MNLGDHRIFHPLAEAADQPACPLIAVIPAEARVDPRLADRLELEGTEGLRGEGSE